MENRERICVVYHYCNGKITYPFIILNNAHTLKSHKPTVWIAIHHLSAHILVHDRNKHQSIKKLINYTENFG